MNNVVNGHIISRLSCPVCNFDDLTTVFNMGYDEPIVKKYIDLMYQGNANTKFLKGVNFKILICEKCNMVFQKNVLDEQKSQELYSQLIDPKLAKKWHKQRNKYKRALFYLHL